MLLTPPSPTRQPSTRHATATPSYASAGAELFWPEFATDLLQFAKGVIAATAAWWLSDSVLDSQMAFLAPWTALLTVHATVYRSLSRGVQTTIFVLGSGFDSQQPLLGNRLLELGLGVAVGLVVNLLVVPLLQDRQAARYIDSLNRQMGDVLIDMPDQFHRAWDADAAQQWFERTEAMTQELESAWQTVRFARESRRINPPTALRSSRLGRRAAADAGRSIADPDAEVQPIFDRLEQLPTDSSKDLTLPQIAWPFYGSLITSLRHIVVIVDDVASARRARESG